jgi:hypothetical protein
VVRCLEYRRKPTDYCFTNVRSELTPAVSNSLVRALEVTSSFSTINNSVGAHTLGGE